MSTRKEKELLLQMLEERDRRRQQDGLFLFKPYHKQQLFLDGVLRSSYYINIFAASNRCGKSFCGAAAGATIARFGVPGEEFKPTVGCVICVSQTTMETGPQPLYFNNGFKPVDPASPPFIPEWEIEKFDTHKQVLKLKNGSIIWFKNATQDVSTFQGAEYQWIHYDEECPKNIYEESSMRGGKVPPRIFFTCTLLPDKGEQGGVSWIFDHFIRPIRNKTLLTAQLFNASVYDNPYVSAEWIAQREAEYPPGSFERRIRLNGELIEHFGGGKVYGNFNPDIHITSDLPPLNPHIPLCLAFDFNIRPLVLVIFQRQYGFFRVYDEIFLQEGTITDLAHVFRERYSSHKAEIWLYGDPNGARRSVQTGQNNYELFMNEVQAYYPFLRRKLRGNPPPEASRIAAFNKTLRDEHGETKIGIDPQCKELIRDLDMVIFDSVGKIRKSSKPSDQYFNRSHISDALGYAIEYESPILTKDASMPHSRTPHFKPPTYSFQHQAKTSPQIKFRRG